MRPAGDAEALAHAILHGHSFISEAIVRGQHEFEDATAVPPEDSTAPVGGFVDRYSGSTFMRMMVFTLNP